MDLRQLRYFLALSEHRSFVRAADAVGITQPAFSRSIQGLEQELGCQLIDRGSKDLRPTPEGQVVLQHARNLVQGAANLSKEIGQMTKLDAGELVFGCGPAPAASLLPEAVSRFSRSYPRVRTRFDVSNWENLSRSLVRDEIEFMIADTRNFDSDPAFDTRPLRRRSGAFICRPGHPLLARDSLSTNDLFSYPLASTRIPVGARKLLANLSGKLDFSPDIESDHLPTLYEIVRRTDAIGIGSRESVRQLLASGELVELHLRNLPRLDELRAHCGIITRAGYRLSPAARAMIEVVEQIDREWAAQAVA